MGRELKRVPLDFDWPMGHIWKGYYNPYSYHACSFCKDRRFKPDMHGFSECKYCEGSGELICDKKYIELRDDWAPLDPPTGEGYQLWETTGEGSAISPVFKTLEDLCAYAEKNCTTFGYSKAPAAAWKKMLDGNFVYHEEGNAIFI